MQSNKLKTLLSSNIYPREISISSNGNNHPPDLLIMISNISRKSGNCIHHSLWVYVYKLTFILAETYITKSYLNHFTIIKRSIITTVEIIFGTFHLNTFCAISLWKECQKDFFCDLINKSYNNRIQISFGI